MKDQLAELKPVWAGPAITPELVKKHNLTPEEFEKIKGILGREPNYTELGIFSVMWSEHCSYKSTRVHLRRLPTKATGRMTHPAQSSVSSRPRSCWT